MKKVGLLECSDYNIDELTEKINFGINLIGGWHSFIKPGMRVLLKVNLIGPKTSDTAAITHSEFVRAITRILKGKGCEVWIGDSSGGAIGGITPTAKSLILSGLEKVALEEGARIKNFDREGVVEVIPESGFNDKMYLAKPLLDADLVINLPKLKTHSAGVYTGAVKNLFGCIPGLRKAEYHKLAPNPKDLGNIITDIHRAAHVQLHIMDAVTAMEGEGPTAGTVYRSGKILLSTDPLALDTVAAKMIGLNIGDVPILQTAKERGLGTSDIKKIEIIGDYSSIPTLPDFKLPKRFTSRKIQNYSVLPKLIKFLKTRPRINQKIRKKCNMCVESCPVKAIDRNTKIIDYNICIECMCCHELCLYKAVELKKDNIIADVMTKLYSGSYK